MRIFFIILLAFLSPQILYPQSGYVNSEGSDDPLESVTENHTYSLITPVLLRHSYTTDSEKTNADNAQRFFDKPGVGFVSSVVIPGSGQIANRNWFRAGLYMALEAISIYMIVDYRNRGINGEKRYERFADDNWSVVRYAEWLVNYHDIHSISNPYLAQLRSMLEGMEPTFDPSKEWNQIDITILRNVEKHTPYFTTDQLNALHFSHLMPRYGSQQYYELISKYYQYQAGWRDYHDYHDQLGHTNGSFQQRYFIDRNGVYASPFFFHGGVLSKQFNSDFRRSRTFTHLLIANHFISAFDAYFTISLKQNRINATSTLIPGEQLVITYSF